MGEGQFENLFFKKLTRTTIVVSNGRYTFIQCRANWELFLIDTLSHERSTQHKLENLFFYLISMLGGYWNVIQ